MIGSLLSFAVEIMQIALPNRCPSLLDVALNIAGTGIGATIGVLLGGRMIFNVKRLRLKLQSELIETSAAWLTAGLLMYHLIPFDFVTSTSDLHASFLRGSWYWPECRAGASENTILGPIVEEVQCALWCVALGYLAALSGLRERRTGWSATIHSAVHGAVLVCLIECLQLFTRSHRFEMIDILIRCQAVFFGAWFAVFIVDRRTRSAWMIRTRLAAPTLILILLAAWQVTMLFGDSVRRLTTDWSFSVPDVLWLPFLKMWRSPMTGAVVHTLSIAAAYSALSLTFTILFRRSGIKSVRFCTAASVCLISAAVEGMQSAMLERAADVTQPILAATFAFVSAKLWCAVRPSEDIKIVSE